MDREIPTRLEEITADWLTGALRSRDVINETTSVTSCDAKILGTGEGFAGDLARLSVTYKGGDGPATMVAKVPTSIDENRSGSEMLGVYEREIRMYEHVISGLGVPHAQLYYADVEPNPDWEKQIAAVKKAERLPIWLLRFIAWVLGRFVKPEPRPSVLILEDLAPAEIGDQVVGADIERVGDVLEVAARLHAATWGEKLPAPGPWLQSGGLAPRFFQASFLGMRKQFLKADGANISPHMRKMLDRLKKDGEARGRRIHNEIPQCLIHGDLRLDNIFFAGNEVRALIDWQLTRTGPAVVDVAYFIAGSLDPSVSEADVDRALGRYHDALVAAGISDYPKERFMADFDDALMSVLGSITAVVAIDLGDDRGKQLGEKMVSRLDARLGRIAA
ncbi:MAG: hypothetical protein ACI9MX_000307 [Candidatus Aldehydirespiratoraceae bacterium]|jgi:hypothetical protein